MSFPDKKVRFVIINRMFYFVLGYNLCPLHSGKVFYLLPFFPFLYLTKCFTFTLLLIGATPQHVNVVILPDQTAHTLTHYIEISPAIIL